MNLAAVVPLSQKAAYLRTLPAIRERCSKVHALATQGKLQYFDYHPENEALAVDLCIDIMKVFHLIANYCPPCSDQRII